MGAARSARQAFRNHEDVMSARPSDYVDSDRLWQRHMTMATHGATASGGVKRLALTPEEAAARGQMMAWAAPLKLEVSTDAAGNVFFRLPGSDADAPAVLTGSHLDTQPTGGKFDGVYGVLAGLEAVEAIIAAGIKPRRPIDIVAWMNEEGSRFAPGMMGSAAFAGARPLDKVLRSKDADGVTVSDALEQTNRLAPDIPLRPLGGPVHAYVEAHIEQGPILEREGYSVGVVTGIQGKRTFRVVVKGEAAHAGTAPRRKRKDALLAAVEMIRALNLLLRDDADIVKFTVGRLVVVPNAPSVVPSEASFSIDLRHPRSDELIRLGDRIATICMANAGPCEVEVEELSSALSLEFPSSVRDCIRGAADRIGIRSMDIHSAAGHDARYLHDICPSGMIFIPCHLGITHNEAESALASDMADGARVLTEVLAELAIR
jgi:N-carbamoyl-L-amino-acid hydrolase